jgi:hypothetical protein
MITKLKVAFAVRILQHIFLIVFALYMVYTAYNKIIGDIITENNQLKIENEIFKKALKRK